VSRYLNLVSRRPGWVLGALLLPTVLSLLALLDPETGHLRLRVDPSVERLLPQGDEERDFWSEARRVFGEQQTALVALPTDDVFSPDSLARIARLTRRLEDLPGVRRVVSLANAPYLDEDAGSLREQVRSNPLYRGVLVSADERVAAFVVFFEDLSDAELMARDYGSRIAAAASPDEVWVTGAPILQATTARLLLRQLGVVVPGAMAAGALILLLAFGSLRGVLLPVATMLLAVLWLLGTLAASGRALDLVTIIVPLLIVALGLAYAMHVVAEYYRTRLPEAQQGSDAEAERVRRSLAAVAVPLLVAGLSTAAGLAALILSPLAAIRDFALLALLGLVYTLALCLSLVPAGLSLAGRMRPGRPPPAGGLFGRLATRLASFDVRRRRAIVVVGVLLLLLGGAGATRIEAGASYIRDFRPDEPARLHYEAIDAAFGGATPLSIVIETNLPDAFTDPELLGEVEALQDWLERQPEVGGTTSLVDHLKLLHEVMTGEGRVLPASQRLAKQLLVSGGGEAIEGYADLNFHTTRIAVRTHVESSEALGRLLERIERRLARLPPLFQARVTGDAVLLARVVERIAIGQALSFGLALVAIYAILAVLFTSLRVGLYALLPNAIPLAVYFGLLGFAGLPLDPASSVIACIALGIAVDDTVHYMVRFRSDARRFASEQEATARTLRAVIRPISFTSLLLCAAFLMLTASELRNQVQFGLLAAFTLAVAWVVDVTLTPALCAGMRIVTFWDVLRVDLGADPRHSIPLMEGLSRREARTVALILDFRELSAGEPLVRQGDRLDEVYVVIEGELAVWTERDGRRVDLYVASRGDVVGEVGFFATESPAHVVATCDARLLRFEDSDLEYLVARHPRIAAHVYRNLNRAQAGLLVAAARRIG
jgi:predicted RND superfamily exporter protein